MPTTLANTVEVVVFRKEGGQALFLVLHRRAHGHHAGFWSIVREQLRSGETAAQGAVRTVREATDLPTTSLWALDYVHNKYDPLGDIIHLVPVFVVEVRESAVSLIKGEYDETRWVTAEQAMQKLEWRGHREGVRCALEDVVTAVDHGALFRVHYDG